MKLDHYISKLLFRYDCVIVPNLGGFVTNYKPANIHPVKNTFYPPSKGISFNKNLVHNDGLLANAICQENNISYEKALSIIEQGVAKIQQDLKLRQKINFDNVGVLFYDNDNRLQFEPSSQINYLLESYGLSSFQQFPVKRKTLEEKIKETPILPINQPSGSKKWLKAAAILVPLTALAIWLPTKYELTSNINYANLNPFKEAALPIYTERTEMPIFEKATPIVVDEATKTVSFIKTETPIVVVNPVEETVVKVDSTYVKTSKVLSYHIIGGCFAERENAENFVKELATAGFNASIIGKRKGLFAVSYNSFSSRKEAVDGLAMAKNHNTKAWILHQ